MTFLDFLWVVWLAVFVIALIIEASTSELVSIWFALGALFAVVISVIPGAGWWISLIVFAVISVATLLCLRPLANRLLKRNTVRTNIDEIIHKKGKMVKGYDEYNHGEVKINGVIWTAINTEEKKPLPEGTSVEVLAVDGNKLVVKEIVG
ncbi:MAG: NfeD family protein [Bacilli bacterium]|nr:NfeD family protein [Bacilli bacterium]